MSSHAYQTDTFEREGLTFQTERFYDATHGAPWEEEEGHGPVSDWRRNQYSIYPEKRPGERVLSSDRNSYRYYDVAEATRIAKRDRWGLNDKSLAKLTDELGRHPTQGEITARAVEEDFEFLRRWCTDQWHYCGIVVTLLDVAGEETHLSESLWGIDSESEDYIDEIAAELADRIISQVGTSRTVSALLKHRSIVSQVRP